MQRLRRGRTTCAPSIDLPSSHAVAKARIPKGDAERLEGAAPVHAAVAPEGLVHHRRGNRRRLRDAVRFDDPVDHVALPSRLGISDDERSSWSPRSRERERGEVLDVNARGGAAAVARHLVKAGQDAHMKPPLGTVDGGAPQDRRAQASPGLLCRQSQRGRRRRCLGHRCLIVHDAAALPVDDRRREVSHSTEPCLREGVGDVLVGGAIGGKRDDDVRRLVGQREHAARELVGSLRVEASRFELGAAHLPTHEPQRALAASRGEDVFARVADAEHEEPSSHRHRAWHVRALSGNASLLVVSRCRAPCRLSGMSSDPDRELKGSEVRLWRLIEERATDGADVADIDRRIWDLFGETWAVVFTDLSGFSRRVAAFGITHFLQVIFEQKRLLLPIAAAHDGILIKVEADSFLIIFKRADSALRACIAMQKACAQYNQDRAPEEQVLLCLGIGYGPLLRIGDTDVYGQEVNVASKLGEDIAQAREILVTDAVRVAAAAVPGVTFEPLEVVVAGAEKTFRVVAAPT